MSLDTKYRPQNYKDILGQDANVLSMKGLVSKGVGRHQSYLISGGYGCGKTTIGRILARALLCDAPIEGEPCDKCESCKLMLDGGNHDAFVEVDAASKSGKADVERILNELEVMTFSGKKRIYLFDESHRLSEEAKTALLKPMEDNEYGTQDKRLVCIFCTTEPSKMKDTIRSRCVIYTIKDTPMDKIVGRLKEVCEAEGFKYDLKGLLLIALHSKGHIRDCLKALEMVAFSSGNNSVEEGAVRDYLQTEKYDLVLKMLGAVDVVEALKYANELLDLVPVGEAYNLVGEAGTMLINKWLGVKNPDPLWEARLVSDAIDNNSIDDMLNGFRRFSERVLKGATKSMFLSDILGWKYGMGGSMIETANSHEDELANFAKLVNNLKESDAYDKDDKKADRSLMGGDRDNI